MVKSTDNAYKISVEKAAGRGGTFWFYPLEIVNSGYSSTSLTTIPDNSNILFKIIIKNNIDILIKEIICNKNDLLILIDNFNEVLLERLSETFIYINCKNSDMISNIIKIELGDNNVIYNTNSILDLNKITLTIYDYINEMMIKILQIDITDSINDLINEIESIINQ